MGYCSPRDWLSEIWGHVVWYSNIVIWALVTQCFFFFKANRFWTQHSSISLDLKDVFSELLD